MELDQRPRCPECGDVLIEGECIQHGVVSARPQAVAFRAEPDQPSRAEPAAFRVEPDPHRGPAVGGGAPPPAEALAPPPVVEPEPPVVQSDLPQAPPGQRARMITPSQGPAYVVFEPESVARERERREQAQAAARAAEAPAQPPVGSPPLGNGAAQPAPHVPRAARPAPPGSTEHVSFEVPQRGMLYAAGAGGMVLLLILFGLWRGQAGLRTDITALRNQIGTVAGQIDEADRFAQTAGSRLKALERRVGGQIDVQKVSDRVLKSVFTIRAGRGVGTGFVVRNRGNRSILLTNAHVVGTFNRVTVRQKGRAPAPGRVLNRDLNSDLALVSVKRVFPPLRFEQGFPKQGEPVVVVGSPLGLGQSISDGLVSGRRAAGGVSLIQISAPVSPGNSGSPVVNRQGRVIGVVTLKIVIQGAEGLAFAVPISDVCHDLLDC